MILDISDSSMIFIDSNVVTDNAMNQSDNLSRFGLIFSIKKMIVTKIIIPKTLRVVITIIAKKILSDKIEVSSSITT